MSITLSDMTEAASALLDAEAKTAAAEAALKDAKEHERKLREEVIPSMFSELELKKYVLRDGSVFSVKQEVYASIPATRREEAYKKLETEGFGGLIKTEVSCEFGKGQLESAIGLAAILKQQGYDAAMGRSVHPMTLKAWAREQLAQGRALDLELFGIRAVDTAKVEAA